MGNNTQVSLVKKMEMGRAFPVEGAACKDRGQREDGEFRGLIAPSLVPRRERKASEKLKRRADGHLLGK